ncbi:MAG: carboxypeptidase-like regulatory domain-containing protein, partial [Saprospiraceae bacterium]
MKLFIWFCFYFLMFSSSGYSQKNYTISGYIKEYGSGETMIGANLFLISNPATGTVSNSYGFYSFTLPEGEHRLLFSYLGYASEQIN